jgi:hypothetical protein
VALSDLHKWRDDGSWVAGDLDALQKRRSRRVIVSALDDQRAMNYGPYPGRSLFTGCLFDGLSGGLAMPGRYATTGRELGQYLRTCVATYTQSAQTPDCGAFELDDCGDIMLPIVSPAVAGGTDDGARPRSPAAHLCPPEGSPAVMQAPPAETAASRESSPGPVRVAASTMPGSARVNQVAHSKSTRHGLATIGLVILGIGAAFAYTVTNDSPIAGDLPTMRGSAAAPDGSPALSAPASTADASTVASASTAPHKPAGPADAPTAVGKRDSDDRVPPGDDTPPSWAPSRETRTQLSAKSVAAGPSKASDEVTAAWRRRKELQAEDEKRILEHVDKQLARPRNDERHFSYRILRGQLLLLRVIRSAGLPAAEYLPSLRGYVDNQLALIKELQTVQSTRGLPPFIGFHHLAPGDSELAESAGVREPGDYVFVSPHVVMRDLAALLMFGTPPFFDSSFRIRDEDDELDMREPEPTCYYKLDHDWSALAIRLLDDALGEISAHGVPYKEREAVQALQEYAHVYLVLGQPKQAVAKLQSILTTYPRSDEFNKVQRELEDLSNGEAEVPKCRDPR